MVSGQDFQEQGAQVVVRTTSTHVPKDGIELHIVESGESHAHVIASVWCYAVGLCAIVGASAVWVSGSFHVLLPIGAVALLGGLIGTWVASREAIAESIQSGSSSSENRSGGIFR
jgi:hypothetical protein